MKVPAELRHEHFRHLYLEERARRESIRSSIATPVAAISFAVFALGNLAGGYDAQRWHEPVALVIALFAGAAVLALLGAVHQVFMVEWLFVHHEPPGLEALVEAEERIRAAEGEAATGPRLAELLGAGYAIAYEQHLFGNVVSARSRTRALRLVLAALTCLALGFLALPFHAAG